MKTAFNPNLKIGILGGGQLGRMVIQEAINFNYAIHILDKEGCPCADYATKFVAGDILNYEDVLNFGVNVDILSIEIENVNVQALYELEKRGVQVFPQPSVIELIQDKGAQKEFYAKNNLPTAPYKLVLNKHETIKNEAFLPFMQKLRRGGYDGKGVTAIKNVQDFDKAFDAPVVLEQFIDFDKELSIIVARNKSGQTVCFSAVEQEFNSEANLVEFLFSPAEISKDVNEKAKNIAIEIISKLEMVGLLAVEFFLTKKGELLINEIAPRPHNSGHQTIEANFTSQFEQLIRAITNLPLGNTDNILPAVMINVLGGKDSEGIAQYEGMNEILSETGVYPHLYGKTITKPFRKMGHITIINQDLNKAKAIALSIKDKLKVIGK